MKKFIVISGLFVLASLFYACESCECDCQGDVNIQNNSGIAYSFEIRKGSSVVFKGSMMGNDDLWFGLEEGKFTFVYGEQTLDHDKSFNIKDCETTVLKLSK